MTATSTTPAIGVCLLPEYPWVTAADLWRRIESMGAAHGWTYDHLVWGGLPDSPWHSTMPFLTAAATVTTTLPLGTFVASPNFRHPALLAKDAVTLDDVSEGRLLLGLGAGGEIDSRLLGHTYTRGERTRRFAEFVALLDRLLTEEKVVHGGEFYDVDGTGARPKCVQQPRVPFLIAANGPRSMRLVATYGQGWITNGPQTGPAPEQSDNPGEQLERWWAGVEELAAEMSHIETEHRTADEPLRRYLSLDAAGPPALSSTQFAKDQVARAGELGFTDVIVHWPRPEPPYHGSAEVLEELLSVNRAQ